MKVYILMSCAGIGADVDIIGVYESKNIAEHFIHDVGFEKIKGYDVDDLYIEEHKVILK